MELLGEKRAQRFRRRPLNRKYQDDNELNQARFYPELAAIAAGRPVGSRSQFSASFLRDMAASWSKAGPDVLAKVARNDPSRYLAVCSTLIPKDVTIASNSGFLGAQP